MTILLSGWPDTRAASAMAEDDLIRFLDKVQQLQQLAESLKLEPERRRQLADCQDHNSVVGLARQWGFDIGRRWGEQQTASRKEGNLLSQPLPSPGTESERTLIDGERWWLHLIHSNDFQTPQGQWLVQEESEWVLLLRGSAELMLKDPEELIDLSVGDPVLIDPRRPHRVERTDPDPGTVWLALYWRV
tara:strand:- start:134 stop:700 length:567 start_codon:yes stop_codon:yes gene_type:complete